MELKSKAKRTDAVKYFRFLIYSKGFTFVELLTSIAIIGILAAVGIQLQVSE
jgi:prepilin-type N-terminal cleavage/methylation domain-containing protein